MGSLQVRGHALDVVITRENSDVLFSMLSISDPNLYVVNENSTCDHFAISTNICVAKPSWERKTIQLRATQVQEFSKDSPFSACLQISEGSLDEIVLTYNAEVSSIIDKHAPLLSKYIILRPNTPMNWELQKGNDENLKEPCANQVWWFTKKCIEKRARR